MNHNSPRKLKPKKFKFRAKPNPEEVKEFRTVDKRSIEELCEEGLDQDRGFFSIRYIEPTGEKQKDDFFDHMQDNDNKMTSEAMVDGYRLGFKDGFLKAKEIIRKFLLNKQMGYGEAFFFRISNFDELNENKPTEEINSIESEKMKKISNFLNQEENDEDEEIEITAEKLGPILDHLKNAIKDI